MNVVESGSGSGSSDEEGTGGSSGWDTFKKIVDEERAKNKALRKENKGLKKQVRGCLEGTVVELSELKKKVEGLTEENQALRELLEENNNSNNGSVASLKRKLKDYEKQVTSLNKEQKEKDKRLKSLEGALEAGEATITYQQEKLEESARKLAAQQEDLGEFKKLKEAFAKISSKFGINQGATPRKRKKTSLVSQGGPKRPSSSYFYFCQEERSKLKARNPKGKISAKQLGKMWAELKEDSERERKRKYQQLARKDRSRYYEELAAFKKRTGIALSSAVCRVIDLVALEDKEQDSDTAIGAISSAKEVDVKRELDYVASEEEEDISD